MRKRDWPRRDATGPACVESTHRATCQKRARHLIRDPSPHARVPRHRAPRLPVALNARVSSRAARRRDLVFGLGAGGMAPVPVARPLLLGAWRKTRMGGRTVDERRPTRRSHLALAPMHASNARHDAQLRGKPPAPACWLPDPRRRYAPARAVGQSTARLPRRRSRQRGSCRRRGCCARVEPVGRFGGCLLRAAAAAAAAVGAWRGAEPAAGVRIRAARLAASQRRRMKPGLPPVMLFLKGGNAPASRDLLLHGGS
eukprot:364512-Chlamydomonas_euryale.AAC.5